MIFKLKMELYLGLGVCQRDIGDLRLPAVVSGNGVLRGFILFEGI